MKLPLFLMVFVNVYIHFRIGTRIRIRNLRVTDPDPAKIPDPCGSGSTTLLLSVFGSVRYDISVPEIRRVRNENNCFFLCAFFYYVLYLDSSTKLLLGNRL
jgi:hypothetical protein